MIFVMLAVLWPLPFGDSIYAEEQYNQHAIEYVHLEKIQYTDGTPSETCLVITGENLSDVEVKIDTGGPIVYLPDNDLSQKNDHYIRIKQGAKGVPETIFNEGIKEITLIKSNVPTKQVKAKFTVASAASIDGLTGTENKKIYTDEILTINIQNTKNIKKVIVQNKLYKEGKVGEQNQYEIRGNTIQLKVSGDTEISDQLSSIVLHKYDSGIHEGSYREHITIFKDSIKVIPTFPDLGEISISPASGPARGGTVIDIQSNLPNHSTGFPDDIRVFLGRGTQEAEASILGREKDKINPDSIKTLQVMTPPSPKGMIGQVDIILRQFSPQGDVIRERILKDAFQYNELGNDLYFDAVDPNHAKTKENKDITIEGFNIGYLNTSALSTYAEDRIPDAAYFRKGEGGQFLELVYDVKKQYGDTYRLVREIRTDIGNRSDLPPFKHDIHEIPDGMAYKKQEAGAEKAVFGYESEELGEKSILEVSKVKDKFVIRTPLTQLEENELYKHVNVQIQTNTKLFKNNVLEQQVVERYTKKDFFIYYPDETKPEIISITPTYGPYDKNIQITMKGNKFQVMKKMENGSIRSFYPVIQIGNDEIGWKTIDPNYTAKDKVVVYDDAGNEVNGFKYTLGTMIKTTIPAGDPLAFNMEKADVKVRIKNPDGGTTTTEDYIFQYRKPSDNLPVITDVEPNRVPTTGGSNVIIKGNHFKPNVIVTIDGEIVPRVMRNTTGNQISFKVPKGLAGKTKLQVINPDGGLAEWNFEYVQSFITPTITSMIPNYGSNGTLVMVKGKNFVLPDVSADADEIEKRTGAVVLIDGKEINDYLYNETGDKKYMIDKNGYSYLIGQNGQRMIGKIMTIDPVLEQNRLIYHLTAGDSTYTIKEEEGRVITDAPASITDLYQKDGSHYQLKKDETNEKVIVSYTLEDKEYLLYEFILKEGSLSVNPILQGTTVYEDAGREKDTIPEGWEPGQYVKVIDHETILFKIPKDGNFFDYKNNQGEDYAIGFGPKQISVRNPDTSISNALTFNYMNAQSQPEIKTISPSVGTKDGGTMVSIRALDIEEGIRVFFGEKEAIVTKTVIDENRIEVITPAYPYEIAGNDAVAVPVTIINSDGGSDASFMTNGQLYNPNGGYVYKIPGSDPRIDRIVPDTQSPADRTPVEIRGYNFRLGEVFIDRNHNEVADSEEERYPILKDENKKEYIEPRIGVRYYLEDAKIEERPNGSSILFIETNEAEKENPKYTAGEDYLIPMPKIYFGGDRAGITRFTKTNIFVRIPKHTKEETVAVTLINPDAGQAIGKFNYKFSKPSIESITPSKAPKTGGTEVVIRGNGFINGNPPDQNTKIAEKIQKEDGMTVTFQPEEKIKSIREPYTEINLGNLFIQFDRTKLYNITIRNGEGKIITEEVIHEGDVKWIEIKKSHFMQNVSEEEDRVIEKIKMRRDNNILGVTRGYSSFVEWINDTTIRVLVPPTEEIGKRQVTVYNNDGGKATTSFEYTNPDSEPIITDIKPRPEIQDGQEEVITTADQKGGLELVILGKDFRKDIKVFIGGKEAVVTYRNPAETELRVEVPPLTDTTKLNKKMEIIVQNGDGNSVNSIIKPSWYDPARYGSFIKRYFMYIEAQTHPQIESISPKQGSRAGTTDVTIVGNDFRSTFELIVGGQIVSKAERKDYKTITATIPPNTKHGSVSITLRNLDDANTNIGEVTVNDAFTYISYPAIDEVYQTKGKNIDGNYIKGNEVETLSNEGGDTILIEGQDLESISQVIFGGKIIALKNNTPMPNKGVQGIGKEGLVYVEGGTSGKILQVNEKEGYIVVQTPPLKEDVHSIILVNKDGGISDDQYQIKYVKPRYVPDQPPCPDYNIIDEQYIKLYGYGIEDAKYYEIYIGESSDIEKMEYLTATEKDTYVITKLKKIDDDLYFRIRAVNEFGPSDYSRAVKIRESRLDDMDRVGDKDRDGNLKDENQITINKDGVHITIGEKGFKGGYYSYFTIDLKDAKYKKTPKKILNIPGTLIQDSTRKIVLDMDEVELRLTPRNFYTKDFWLLTNNEQKKAYGRVCFQPLEGREADIASRYLTKKQRLVSKIYTVTTEIQEQQEIKNLSAIYGDMDIAFDYDKSSLFNINEATLKVYQYDRQRRSWMPLESRKEVVNRKIYAKMNQPGIYAIIGEK